MTTLSEWMNKQRELERQATKGSWSAYCKGKTVAIDIGPKATGQQPCIVKWPGFDGSDLSTRQNKRNARFIADARTALPLLVKILRALLTEDHVLGVQNEAIAERILNEERSGT